MEILAVPSDNSSGGFVKWLKKKLKERSLKEKKAISEAMVNVQIATHVFSKLTSGSIIVNKSQAKSVMADTRIFKLRMGQFQVAKLNHKGRACHLTP